MILIGALLGTGWALFRKRPRERRSGVIISSMGCSKANDERIT